MKKENLHQGELGKKYRPLNVRKLYHKFADVVSGWGKQIKRVAQKKSRIFRAVYKEALKRRWREKW